MEFVSGGVVKCRVSGWVATLHGCLFKFLESDTRVKFEGPVLLMFRRPRPYPNGEVCPDH